MVGFLDITMPGERRETGLEPSSLSRSVVEVEATRELPQRMIVEGRESVHVFSRQEQR
tara:strand:- start:1926 stop:2099 length:174 start_codon:yes stop_codon:yes gene_type:complete